MPLVIVGVRDIGNIDKERAVFRADTEVFLGRQVVVGLGVGDDLATSSFDPGTFIINSGFWFPNATVKNGDTVVLYTKTGKPKKKDHISGRTSHFFYFGKSAPFWVTSLLAVMELKEWSHFAALASEAEESE